MRRKLLISALAFAALAIVCYFMLSTSHVSVTVNGEHIEGAKAMGIAGGGMIAALSAVAFAAAVCCAIALGVSVMVGGVLAAVLCLSVILLAPMLLPIGIILLVVAWLLRKKPNARGR